MAVLNYVRLGGQHHLMVTLGKASAVSCRAAFPLGSFSLYPPTPPSHPSLPATPRLLRHEAGRSRRERRRKDASLVVRSETDRRMLSSIPPLLENFLRRCSFIFVHVQGFQDILVTSHIFLTEQVIWIRTVHYDPFRFLFTVLKLMTSSMS